MSPKVKNEQRSEATPLTTQATAPVGPQAAATEPPVTFAKWFKARSRERGYKPHWVAGMQAFTDTNAIRSMTEWDEIFKAY